jgi:O-antigen/teichoic acid export membrane protein
VVCFNEIFVALWVGADRYGGLLLSVVMAANTFALAFTVFSTWCLTGTGHLNAILRMTIVTTIFDLSATLIFTQSFGLIGPVLGSCSTFYFCTLPWHARLLSSQFQISRMDLIKSVAAPLLMAPPYAVLILSLKQVFHVDQWYSLALVMVGPILIYLMAAILFVLDKQDRQIILKRFGFGS